MTSIAFTWSSVIHRFCSFIGLISLFNLFFSFLFSFLFFCGWFNRVTLLDMDNHQWTMAYLWTIVWCWFHGTSHELSRHPKLLVWTQFAKGTRWNRSHVSRTLPTYTERYVNNIGQDSVAYTKSHRTNKNVFSFFWYTFCCWRETVCCCG